MTKLVQKALAVYVRQFCSNFTPLFVRKSLSLFKFFCDRCSPDYCWCRQPKHV